MLYQFSSISNLLRVLYDEWMLTFVTLFLHLLSSPVIFSVYSVNMENYTDIFLDVKPNFHSCGESRVAMTDVITCY